MLMPRIPMCAHLLLLLCCLPALPVRARLQSPRWRHPKSDVRLHVLPVGATPHTLRVDLPDAFHAYRDVDAFDPSGVRIPYRPVQVGGRLLAVELSLDADVLRRANTWSGVAGACRVYLFQQQQQHRPLPFPAAPVFCRQSLDKVIARPGTAQEYLQYQRNRPTLQVYGELSEFPKTNLHVALAGKPKKKNKQKVRLQCSALLHADRRQTVEFSVAGENCGPWYLVIDGRPVFSWGRFRRRRGRVMSPPVRLQPGLARLDFYTILSPSEAMPQLVWREAGGDRAFKALPVDRLFTPRPAMGLCLERRRDLASPGARVQLTQAFACRDTGVRIGVARVTDLSRQWFQRPLLKRRYRFNASPFADIAGETTLFLARRVNHLELRIADGLGEARSVKLPLRFDWSVARDCRNRLRLQGLPLFEPAGDPLLLRYRVTPDPGIRRLLLDHADIVLRQVDGDGAAETRTVRLPESPFKRRLQVEPAAGTVKLSLALQLADAPVAAVQQIYRVGPGDGLRFKPGGDQLRYADGFAVLRRPRRASNPARWMPARIRGRLVLVDDFVATTRHATDDFPLADWPWQQAGNQLELKHVPLGGTSLSATRPRLRKFIALQQALADEPGAVVFAVGDGDLAGGMDRRDFHSQLLFLVEACRRRGVPIILVTLPLTKRLPADRVRECALDTKELARHYGLPVVDLYSITVRHGEVSRYWQIPGAATVTSATMNAAGRKWFCRAVQEVLDRLAESTGEGGR